MVNVGSENLELLQKTGTQEKIGAENFYQTVRGAVASVQRSAEKVQLEK